MARQEEIIIEVEVNAGDAAQKLAQTKNSIAELKAEQKQLNAAIKENGSVTAEQAQRLAEISGELKDLSRDEKMYTSQLNTSTGGNKEFGKSLATMSIELAKMKAEYRNMSKEMRESDAGKQLQASIQNLDKTMKDADAELGDFQRNVGNYQSALLGLNGNVVKVANLFAGGFKNGIAAAGTALKGFAKTILATPVGWISAVIAAAVKVFNELREAFKRNDDAGTALSVALAKLQPIVTAIREGFSALATVVAKVVGGITSAATAVLNLIPAYRKASEAAQELVRAQDALQDRQREYVVNEAERDKEIAELRKKAVSDEKLTAKEREDIYKKIDEISRQGMEERKNIAAENYRILQEEAKKNNDTSDAMKDRLAQSYAEMIKAQTDYLTETTRIGSRQRQAREEQAKQEAEEAKRQAEERKRRWQEAQKNREEAEKKATEELRKLEDMRNAMIEDEAERQRATINTTYSRQIDDLQKRLDTEKNLTKEARESITEQQKLLREQMWKELADVDDEQLKKAGEAALKGQQEAEKRLEEARKLTREEYERETLALSNDMQQRMNEIYGNVVKASEVEMEVAQTNYDRLKTMDAETKSALFENEEQYRAAVLDAEAQIMEARTKNEEALKAQAAEVAQTMQAVTGALSSLYEAAAGDSEEYEKFKKAMAIADAAISLAQTIAAATSASTAGDPYTMAIRIASNVAAVTAQFAAVVKAIKAAAVPSAPKFAEGGVVPGTSYTGDKVLIRANSGERVLTKEMSDNLVKMLAQGVPAWGMDYERLEQAFVRAASRVPAPVLDYSEFVAYGRKVAMEKEKMMEY